MAFRVPSFPSLAGIWHFGNVPPAAPDLISPCQLTPGRRSITPFVRPPAGSVVPGSIHLLLPKATDVRDGKAAGGADLVEVPIGSGRFYDCVFVDDIGAGFANEHRFAMLRGIATWPLPYPTVRPPEAITPQLVGAGGSLGMAVGNVLFNLNVPWPGLLLIVVADYNSAAGACAASVDGPGVFTPFVSPVAAAFGNTCFTSIFPFVVTPGFHSCGIKVVFGADIFQYQLLFVPALYANTADVGAAAIGAGMPAIAGPAGQTANDEVYLAPFGQINSLGPFGYAGGYVSTGGDVTDVIGAVPCTLSLGSLVTTAIGVYPANMPLAIAGAWTGQVQSWK